MHKKILISIILLAFFLTPQTSQAQNNQEPRKVRVAIYENPPKIFTDSQGKVRGFWADMIDYIAVKENWEVEYVNGSWEEGLARVTNNEVDMMVDVGYSADRAKIYTFTNESAFINWAAIYSKPGLEINSIADLQGKKIAVLDGDIHFEGPLGINALMKSFNYEAEYIHLASYEDNFKAVSEGKADIAIVNRIFGTYAEGNYDVKRTSVVFNPIELKFALPKDGKDTEYFKTALDDNFRELKEDSNSIYYQSIIKNLEAIVQPVEVSPKWTKPLIMGVAVFIILILALFLASQRYRLVLENKVKKTSEELRASETKYEELTELLPQTIFEADSNGFITYINEAGTEIFGYKKEELLNKFPLVKLFAKNDTGKVEESIANITNNQKVENKEFICQKSDKSYFPAYMYASPVKSDGQITGMRGIIADITEQKNIEMKLKENVQELEKLMESMVGRELKMVELKDAIKSLKHKDDN